MASLQENWSYSRKTLWGGSVKIMNILILNLPSIFSFGRRPKTRKHPEIAWAYVVGSFRNAH